MVKPITILGFTIRRAPKDLEFQSVPIPIEILAAQDRTVNFPTEFGTYGTSIAIQNTDAANIAVVSVNGGPSFNVINGSPVSLGDLWVVQIRVIAGALSSTLIIGQQVPTAEVM